MIVSVTPFAPKGAARLPAAASAASKPVLLATWFLDPETGRPVCRWSAEGAGTDGPVRAAPLPECRLAA